MDYTIKRGDTLSQLALANKTSVADLQKANPNITDINKIYAGNTLKIPTSTPQGGTVTPPVVPTTPTTPTAPVVNPSDVAQPTDVGRFVRTPGTYDNAIQDTTNGLNNYFMNEKAPRSYEEIRQAKKDEAQRAADLITSQFNIALSSENKAGAARNDRTRALNVGAGLGGSDFASAAADKTEKGNKEQVDLMTAEKNAKVNELLNGVDDRASEAYATERKAALENLTGRLDLQTKMRDQERAKAKESITGLAGSGVSLERLKSAEPGAYQTLLKEYGGSPVDLETAYNAALPDNMKVKYEQQIIRGENGNATVLRYGVDPRTGSVTKTMYDLGTDYNSMKDIKPIEADGRLYGQNADGTLKPLTDISEKTLSEIRKNDASATADYALAHQRSVTQGEDPEIVSELQDAQDAIANGADSEAVRRRFMDKYPKKANLFLQYTKQAY